MIEFQTMYNRLADGKSLFFETATYVSGTTFKVTGDWTAILAIGQKFWLQNNSKSLFGYIKAVAFASGETTFTIFDMNYLSGGVWTVQATLNNSAITNVYFSGTSQLGGHPGTILLSTGIQIAFNGKSLRCRGWDFIQGNGTNGRSKTISFPMTYLRQPFPVISFVGGLSGASPSVIGDLTADIRATVGISMVTTEDVTTASFLARIGVTTAASYDSAYRIGFAWETEAPIA